MPIRPTTVTLPLLALSLLACTESIGPGDDLVDLALDFCAGEAPIFFAVLNEGDSWRRVSPGAGNTFAFPAGEKVGIAMTFASGTDVVTDVNYVTRAEIEPFSGVACTEVVGSKTLEGTLAGLGANDEVVISMSGYELAGQPPSNTFALLQIPDGPQDLVAHRVSGGVPNAIIVRRALNLIHGATITPTLDFNNANAVATHTGTFIGLDPAEDNYFDIFFNTASGTTHTLDRAPPFVSSSQTLFGVPASLTQAGDAHLIVLNADAADGSHYRSVQHAYRNPGDKTFTLGGLLNDPVIASAGTSPYQRLRATLVSQAEYGDFASAFFGQGTTSTRGFFVTETAGFRDGTPASWDLEIPDLTPAGGFPASAALQAGQPTVWFAEAYSGFFEDLFAGGPPDGFSLQFAGRTSVVSTVQMSRARGARTERRVPLAGRAFRRAR